DPVLTWYTRPRIWIVISGVMATIATTPNASVTISPPMLTQAPMANGSRNVAVIGPEATPPESNAIAVKIFGTKKERIRAAAYTDIRNQKIDIPVSTRILASPRVTATPMERLRLIARDEIVPDVISST